MVDPPPTATNASKRPWVAKSIASRKETSVGSTRTRSKRANETWLSVRLSRTAATGGSLARLASVRTITRWAFISARSMPISRVTPGPKRMLEEASSNAYSRAISRAACQGDDAKVNEHQSRSDPSLQEQMQRQIPSAGKFKRNERNKRNRLSNQHVSRATEHQVKRSAA